jgi:hypothetical protein
MSKECKEHIQNIREEFQASPRVKESLNNSIQALARDLYNKDTHFIFELIQNAEDNTYNNKEAALTFYLSHNDPTYTEKSKGALIIQNNENGFSSKNIDAICSVGKTTKRKIKGYIGEKGIGFKSVFRVTSNPHIFSNGYNFCLPENDIETGLGYIVPQWVDKIPDIADQKLTTIILPLDKKEFGYERIKNMLNDIEPESILFLSKLKEVNIKDDDDNTLAIIKDDSGKPNVQILIDGNVDGILKSKVDEFVLFSESFLKPENIHQEKREEIIDREVSVAFSVEFKDSGVGKIFAYLPVRSDSGFPFLMNADFILPSSREDILDVPWNRWLIECVAELVANNLLYLRDKGLLTIDFLQLLAKRLSVFDNKNDLFYPIFESVQKVFRSENLLPAVDGTFLSAFNLKISRSAELRNLLNSEQLQLLFSSSIAIKWASAEITQDRTPDLRRYLIEHLGIEEIRPEKFVELITDQFIENQSDEWLINFYSFLGNDRADLWKRHNSPIGRIKIIRTEDNSHVVPFQDDGTPNAYLPSSIETNDPIVKKSIFSNDAASDFLKRLGLFEPDFLAEILKLLPKYSSDDISVSNEENIADLRKIKRSLEDPLAISSSNSSAKNKYILRKSGLQKIFPFLEDILLKMDPNEIIISLFRGSPPLIDPKHKLIRASNGLVTEYKLSNAIYLKNSELCHYFLGNSEAWFIVDAYPDEFVSLFEKLGVNQIPIITKNSLANTNGNIIIAESHSEHQRGLNGFDPYIKVDGLQHALNFPTVQKSAFIWNQIVIPNVKCIRGIIEKSRRKTYEKSKKEESVSRNFGRLLLESKWLPGEDGQFYFPHELHLENLPEQFERNEKLADLLGMKKDVISKLADEAGIAKEDIDLLRKYPEEFFKWKKQIYAQNEKPVFPTKEVKDLDRRQERVSQQWNEAPDKKYEIKQRSVRTTRNAIEPSLWLEEYYINKDEQMVCQICKKEMPFKKRNGKYYFEAVEVLSKDHVQKEHESLCLALCPLCAAMYKEFIKKDEAETEKLKISIMSPNDLEIPIMLGEWQTSIQFVEAHLEDLKLILQKENEL